MRNIEQHAPHSGVEDAFNLTKHAAQASSCPLEGTTIAQDAKRHIGLDQLHSPLVQLEEPKKVRAILGVENDLRKKGSQVVGAMARTGRGNDNISDTGHLQRRWLQRRSVAWVCKPGGSICGSMDVRVHADGRFPQQSDMHRVGMASSAIVGLVELYFVCRVLV